MRPFELETVNTGEGKWWNGCDYFYNEYNAQTTCLFPVSGFFMSFVKVGIKVTELHVISTGQQSPEKLASIVGYIHPYVEAVHIRESNWSDRKLTDAIHLLLQAGFPSRKIIMNHRVEVAHAMQLSGVQLTHKTTNVSMIRNKYKQLRIGCSVHSMDGAGYAEKHGADFLLFGHVFETKSKPGMAPKGLESLGRIVQKVSVPVIAIGGITPENAGLVVKHGANGIAVLSGILLADDPLQRARDYKRALQRGGEHETAL